MSEYYTELINYFKGLEIKQVLELARKSIRLETENRKLGLKLSKLEDILMNSRLLAEQSMKYDTDKNITIRTINEMLEIIRGE